MSVGSYTEKRGRGQRYFGGWFGIMVVVGLPFAFFGQSAYAQVASPPAPSGPVTINSVQSIGTGCQKPTTFTHDISDDQRTLTLAYLDYTAEDGVGIAPLEARKNCNIILDITYPSGYRFAISSVNFKGLADLDTGTVGTLAAQYFFQGQSPQVEFVLQATGPFVDNYEALVEKTATEVMYGSCGGGGTLNINTEVRVQGIGIMTVETTTRTFQQIYTLVWQHC